MGAATCLSSSCSSSLYSAISSSSSFLEQKSILSCLLSSSSSSSSSSIAFSSFRRKKFIRHESRRLLSFLPASFLHTSTPAPGPSAEEDCRFGSTSRENKNVAMPQIDESGKFCSPRAARELALSIVYAACLEGSDPVRLFEKRINSRKDTGYKFDKASLVKYNHMSFGGPPVTSDTVEEADELLRVDEKASEIEAEVLSAPPKLVYSKLILRFARKLLVAVVEKWDSHVLDINKVAPLNWKNEPASRILELSILHLAMSEITVLGTRHQIVINEAVDLAKRFCDGAAPRVINGCLRTFVRSSANRFDVKDQKLERAVSVDSLLN